jgi:hypothetical protein
MIRMSNEPKNVIQLTIDYPFRLKLIVHIKWSRHLFL